MMGKDIFYLNPQLINERTLAGYDILDNSEHLAKYNEE
jgi:hypothetical protein